MCLPGRRIGMGQFAPAKINAIQNIHRQFSVDVYPATIGPSSGPKLFINPANIIAFPLCNIFGYRSEKNPPNMYCGADAPTPTKKRKMRRLGQLVASAHANVASVYKAKEERKPILRPKVSLIGPKRMGPNM